MISFDPDSYTLMILTAAYVLLAVGLSLLWLILIRRQLEIKGENLEKRAKDSEKTQKILEEAETEAKRIISQAHERALNLISTSEIFKTQQTVSLTNKLNQAIEVYTAGFKEADRELRHRSQEKLSHVLEEIKTGLLEEVHDFAKQASAETIRSQKETGEMLNQAKQETLAEIEKYRDSRIQALESEVREVIKEVVKQILAREIKDEEHETLIIQAVEEVKQKHLMNA